MMLTMVFFTASQRCLLGLSQADVGLVELFLRDHRHLVDKDRDGGLPAFAVPLEDLRAQLPAVALETVRWQLAEGVHGVSAQQARGRI